MERGARQRAHQRRDRLNPRGFFLFLIIFFQETKQYPILVCFFFPQ